LKRYFNFSSPINFYVGILELVSEFARIISLSFRLFGNIFAGTIVLAIFALLLPVVGGAIFIPFELFVAVIQAFIFSLLTLSSCKSPLAATKSMSLPVNTKRAQNTRRRRKNWRGQKADPIETARGASCNSKCYSQIFFPAIA